MINPKICVTPQNVKTPKMNARTKERTKKRTIKFFGRFSFESTFAFESANENENIVVLLDAKDPDNDQLSYSLVNPPDNSSIKENVFTWTPGYLFASKGEIKKLDLVFAVNDGKSEAKQTGHFEIRDKNRPPAIINASDTIHTDVNKPVFMFVKAYDPDGDKLTYAWDFGLLDRYSGTDKHQRTFTSPGPKEVKVTVSDGTDSTEQIINIFVGGNLTNSGFNYNPSVSRLNLTVRKETRIYNQIVSGSANSGSSNIPIRIIDATSNVIAKVNEPVLMYVKAAGDKGNQLTYTWDFGLFNSYPGSQYHQRTFTSPGVKSVKVTVSDGTYSLVQIITVNVVE